MIKLVKQDFNKNKELYKCIEKKLRINIPQNIPITHVGSTAIPNMYGKNIIDILIGAKNEEELNKISKILINEGYISSDKSKTEIYQFFASKKEETVSGDIHIHLVIMNTDRYSDFIILKKYLLNCKEESLAYSNFKIEIVNKEVVERKEYKNIKTMYVTNLLKKAREYYNKI